MSAPRTSPTHRLTTIAAGLAAVATLVGVGIGITPGTAHANPTDASTAQPQPALKSHSLDAVTLTVTIKDPGKRVNRLPGEIAPDWTASLTCPRLVGLPLAGQALFRVKSDVLGVQTLSIEATNLKGGSVKECKVTVSSPVGQVAPTFNRNLFRNLGSGKMELVTGLTA